MYKVQISRKQEYFSMKSWLFHAYLGLSAVKIKIKMKVDIYGIYYKKKNLSIALEIDSDIDVFLWFSFLIVTHFHLFGSLIFCILDLFSYIDVILRPYVGKGKCGLYQRKASVLSQHKKSHSRPKAPNFYYILFFNMCLHADTKIFLR